MTFLYFCIKIYSVRTQRRFLFMDLINKCIEYLKANLILAYVLIGVAALLVIVLIAIIAQSVKRSKAKKAEEKAQSLAKAQKKAEEEKAEAQKKALEAEAARKAILERLEAERIAAEEAEAERIAREKEASEIEQAKILAQEKAEAERIAWEKQEEKKALEEAEQKKAEKKAKKAATLSKELEERLAADEAKTQKEKAKKAAKKTVAVEPKTTKPDKDEPVLYDELKDIVQEETWDDNDELEKAARYRGKWTIFRVITNDGDKETPEDEMYFFELHASNGEKLLSSEEYTSYNGALRGIQTHKNNILKGNFKITLSKKGDYIFKLLSGKNMLLCMGEHYITKARCESAIESTKRFARTAVLDENVQDHVIKVPVEDDSEVAPLPDGYNGKWIIDGHVAPDGEEVFFFELFANNGEKLLSSEEYTTYIGAVNGIQTHKLNIEKGNFRISLTKRGDYIYKLLNGNGQLLCLGEHYKTKRLCLNAVESVKRFAKHSPVLTDPEHTKKL